jgi:hypothetical protein
MAVPYPFTVKWNNQRAIYNCSLSVLGKKGKPASFVPSTTTKPMCQSASSRTLINKLISEIVAEMSR